MDNNVTPALTPLQLTETCFRNEQERLEAFAAHMVLSQESIETIKGDPGEDAEDGADGKDGATFVRYEFPVAVGTQVVSTGLTEAELKRSIVNLHTTITPDTGTTPAMHSIGAIHTNGDISLIFWNLGLYGAAVLSAPDNTYTVIVKVMNEEADVTP